MRKQIEDNEMELVAGGNYYINKNNIKVAFTTIKGKAYQLSGCTGNQAMDVMDSLIGKYNTTAEYDQACVQALKDAGYLSQDQ